MASETSTTGVRLWSMLCDFNSGGLAAMEGFPDLRPLVKPGDRAVLRDGEGNSCEGVVKWLNPGWDDNYATCRVELDMATWKDGEQMINQ